MSEKIKLGSKEYELPDEISTGKFQEVCGILQMIDEKTRKSKNFTVGEMTGLLATNNLLVEFVQRLFDIPEEDVNGFPLSEVVEAVNLFFIKSGFLLVIMGIFSTPTQAEELIKGAEEDSLKNSQNTEEKTPTPESEAVENP